MIHKIDQGVETDRITPQVEEVWGQVLKQSEILFAVS